MQEFSGSKTWRNLIILLTISSAARLAIFAVVVPYDGVLPSTPPDLEPYQDYKYLYMSDVDRFLNGSLPYRDFFHAYPPLFLYTLSLFAVFHLPSWSSAIPIVAYDALTVIPLFLIARRLTNDKWASIAALTASLTPMVLWYNTALWLNPPPPTFFTLLSAYLMLTGRSRLAALTLGLATGYKQTSIALFPAMFIAAYVAGSRRRAAEFASVFISVCFAVSLPYIIQYPTLYLWQIGVPGIPTPPMYGPPADTWQYDLSTPINIATYFGLLGFTSLATSLRYPLWLLLIASYYLLIWKMVRRKQIGEADFITYLLYSTLMFDTLFPRGIYKYFLNSALPFLAAILYKRRHILFFIGYGLAILAAPRFLTPWLSLLLITMIPHLHRDEEQPKQLHIKPPSKQIATQTEGNLNTPPS